MLPLSTRERPREYTPQERKRAALMEVRAMRFEAGRLRARADKLDHDADVMERLANDTL